MSKWAERAAIHFSQKSQEPTPRSPESTHAGVLGVGSGRIPANEDHLMGVLGVPTPSIHDIQAPTLSPAVPEPAKEWNVHIPAGTSPETIEKFRAASTALDASIPDDALGADSYCWPNGTAMNGNEIEVFQGRLNILSRRGLNVPGAEAMAEKFLARDRDGDDRRMCMECFHLTGKRCGNWQQAGVALSARDAILATEFMNLFQRCHGFAAAVPRKEF